MQPTPDLERGTPAGPSISHPYPPSYRSQLTSPSKPATNPPKLGYEQRRQDRRGHHPSSSGENPYDDPYDGRNEGYGSNLAPSGISRPTRLERSASESSTHPALPHDALNASSGIGASGGGGISDLGGKEGRPHNWTKEDEEAEREFLSKGMVNWNELKSWRFWFRKEWWYWYIIIIVAAVLVALMTIFHDDIVKWMQPFANWMKDLPGGWAIPIGIFFVLSFPPLFGQEILAVLVGAVWGLWAGFGITAAGTFLGEVGNFYAFKYCLRSTAEKYERKNINYACMAHVVREGGFWMIFAIRLSAIPGHFSTAVFATCGMSIWIFMVATILTLPKQLIVVYLGVHFNEEEQQSNTEKAISYVVLIVGFLITIWAAWYIWKKMHQARVHVWRKRRIEAASKGMVLNDISDPNQREQKDWSEPPLVGAHRHGHGHGHGHALTDTDVDLDHGDDADATSPILVHRHGHYSYQNPYDIRYQSRDDMSVYHVDPPQAASQTSLNPNGLGPVVHEQDLGYGYRPAQSTDTLPPQRQHQAGGYLHPQSQPSMGYSAQFPEARSTGTGVLRREPSAASTAYPAGGDMAEFPVPLPAPGRLDHGRDHAHPHPGDMSGAHGYTLAR